MYNRLTEAIKKRIIFELRRFWSYDPVYADDLVPHIQGKYSFRERPCTAIILKGASANHERLAADNFQGTVVSYVHLSKVGNNPGLAVEWVREDGRAIQNNGGVFPSARGIYYIEVLDETLDLFGVTKERRVFYVDPLLEAIDQEPMKLSAFTYQIENFPIHPGSLRVFELPGNIPQIEGVNYTVDNTTGIITLASPLPARNELSIDYRYPTESCGPFIMRDNHTNVDAIPGVVLAFGRRSTPGDIMAVIVGDRREPVALEYGGRWSLSLDLDIMALDVTAQGEITDRTLLYIEGPLRSRLAGEGIDILEVSMGGESEEIYDENGDDYFYNASISLSLQTDWTVHVPLDATIRRVVPQTSAEIEASAAMTDEELVAAGEPNHLRAISQLGLLNARDPFFVGRNQTYEVIK